jgi:prophage regulatory protein
LPCFNGKHSRYISLETALVELSFERSFRTPPALLFGKAENLRAFSVLGQFGARWTAIADSVAGGNTLDNPVRIIRLKAVKARCGLSRSTLYNRIAAGEFPRPIAIGPRAVGWIESEINTWIAARIDASRNGKDSGASRAA